MRKIISKSLWSRKPAIITITIVAGAIAISFFQSNLGVAEKDTALRVTEPLSPLIQSPNDSNVFFLNTENIPEKDGYIFLGYSALADTSRLDYVYDKESNTFSPESVTINAPTDGTAISTLTLYVVWQLATPPAIDDIADATYLQQVTVDVCNSMTLDEQYILKDARDNKEYTIARLKMNPEGTETTCWMTQNLALELSTTKTLTNADTDLNSVTSWTPERDTIATEGLNSSTWRNSKNPYSYDSGNTSYGNYYNWTAAIASNDSSSLTQQYSNAPDSICPKGWRLLQIYGGTSTNKPNEFGNLLYAYGIINNAWPGDGQNAGWASNGFTKIQQAPINSPLAGYVTSGAVIYSGVDSYYWSSSVISSNTAYNLGFNSTYSVTPQNYYTLSNRGYGFLVRCILR